MSLFKRCKHERIRCIHGDEIHAARGRRGACRDCRKLFDALPLVCSVSGKPHFEEGDKT